jgi:farnesyl diphosphate synthase
VVNGLAVACGSEGMAGGQVLDLQTVGETLDINQLEHIHALKTGALIRMSVVAPAWLAQSDTQTISSLEKFGDCIGLGFRIRDDILDITGETEQLGKQALADLARNKPTFPSLIGMQASRQRASELRDQALACLEGMTGDIRPLAWLAEHMISRDR